MSAEAQASTCRGEELSAEDLPVSEQNSITKGSLRPGAVVAFSDEQSKDVADHGSSSNQLASKLRVGRKSHEGDNDMETLVVDSEPPPVSRESRGSLTVPGSVPGKGNSKPAGGARLSQSQMMKAAPRSSKMNSIPAWAATSLPADRTSLGSNASDDELERSACGSWHRGGDDSDDENEHMHQVSSGNKSRLCRTRSGAFTKAFNPDFNLMGMQVKRGYDLHNAIHDGDIHRVRSLITSGASVNVPMWSTDNGASEFVTLLHVLSSRPDLPNCTEIMTELIRAMANLNARSSLGSTPLSQACFHKNLEAAQMLLSSSADPSPVDDNGRNALCCAVSLEIDNASSAVKTVESASASSAESVSGSLVSLLASSGSSVDEGEELSERAPMLEAIRQANRPAVKALLENGAKAKWLHVAVDQAPVSIIEDLLKSHANPFEENKEGKTVLDIAFRRGDDQITTLLRNFIGDRDRVGVVADADIGKNRSANPFLTRRAPDEDTVLGLSRDIVAPDPFAWTTGDSQNIDKKRGSSVVRRISVSISGGMSPRQRRERNLKIKNELQKSMKASRIKDYFHRFQADCRRLNRNQNFQLVMFAALLVVLFFPDLWILCDVTNNDDLDVILVIVIVLFLIELGVQTIGMPKTYINSFFFWTDIVGVCSVPLDHSMVSDTLPSSVDNTMVMRAARMARLGARAGRFTKLVKLLRFLPGVHQEHARSQGTAKSMSSALMTSLSTRVSCLIIVMVMFLPLFELAAYPENDFSMKTWLNSLEFTLDQYGNSMFQTRLKDFEVFYNNKDYYPFEIFWRIGSGNSSSSYKRLGGMRPRRGKNRMEIQADSGFVQAVFNFGPQNRLDAICNVALIVVIIILMMGFSLLLSSSVSAIVLQPLENLLEGVKRVASKIFKSVTNMAAKVERPEDGRERQDRRDGDEGQEEMDFGHETRLLERVIDKLAALSAITMKTAPIDAETLEQLGEGDRAVLQGFSPDAVSPIVHGALSGHRASEVVGPHRDGGENGNDGQAEMLVMEIEKYLEDADLPWRYVDSWDFDVLDLNDRQRHIACLSFMIFHLGLAYSRKKQPILATFVDAASQAYGSPTKVPYHNFFHAADVTHCLFRLMSLCSAESIFSTIERYALITAAICHDVGHPGFNNPFLVETSHELAIRYNDNSPLENMHCAKLFEIASQQKTAVFADFDKAQYKEIRKVCVEAILHTDNVQHFAMVKDMQMLYEMHSEIFDLAMQMYQVSQADFPPREVVDVFAEPDRKKMLRNAFLHISDISNPTKPFEICKKWAWVIMDEFFQQGDQEKELGITVQPLNDRDKVNKAYSQVGFIEFFVTPLAVVSLRLLPPLLGGCDQMMINLHSWCEEWVCNTVPTPDQEDLAKLNDRITKLEEKFSFGSAF